MAQAPFSDIFDLSISEAGALFRNRKLSPVELTTSYLSRISDLDPTLNVFLRLTPELALEQARQSEHAIMSDAYLGGMHGIPFGIKDVYFTAGIATTGHSRAYRNFIPSFSSTAVTKLSQAGAVMLGKLSTHECAHGGPSFDLPWPPARNPWKPEYFTGGSSTGAGAGVAAGMMMAALGTDTGGSIRNPAAMCGTVGLKPTFGLVSRYGVMPNSFSYDHCGPLTWSVEDCAVILQSIAGYDPLDSGSADRPVPNFKAALTGDIRGCRIGILRHFYEEDVPVSSELKAALEEAYDVLRMLGSEIEDVSIRPVQDYFDVKIIMAEAELFSIHEHQLRTDPEAFGDDFIARILAATLVRGVDYVQAQRERQLMLREMEAIYARYDVLITAGPGPAFPFEAWRSDSFWKNPSIATPFNVTGGPSLVQCIGFNEQGMPLAMQIAGRPFDDATVLRIADAYERATSWRSRRPTIDPSFRPKSPASLPAIGKAEIGQAYRDELELLCRRAGLILSARHFEHLCLAAPHLEAMLGRLRRKRGFDEEPAGSFRFL